MLTRSGLRLTLNDFRRLSGKMLDHLHVDWLVNEVIECGLVKSSLVVRHFVDLFELRNLRSSRMGGMSVVVVEDVARQVRFECVIRQ